MSENVEHVHGGHRRKRQVWTPEFEGPLFYYIPPDGMGTPDPRPFFEPDEWPSKAHERFCEELTGKKYPNWFTPWRHSAVRMTPRALPPYPDGSPRVWPDGCEWGFLEMRSARKGEDYIAKETLVLQCCICVREHRGEWWHGRNVEIVVSAPVSQIRAGLATQTAKARGWTLDRRRSRCPKHTDPERYPMPENVYYHRPLPRCVSCGKPATTQVMHDSDASYIKNGMPVSHGFFCEEHGVAKFAQLEREQIENEARRAKQAAVA